MALRAMATPLLAAGALQDPLAPVSAPQQLHLMPWAEAIRAVHCPQSRQQLARAQTSLAFRYLRRTGRAAKCHARLRGHHFYLAHPGPAARLQLPGLQVIGLQYFGLNLWP